MALFLLNPTSEPKNGKETDAVLTKTNEDKAYEMLESGDVDGAVVEFKKAEEAYTEQGNDTKAEEMRQQIDYAQTTPIEGSGQSSAGETFEPGVGNESGKTF